MNPEDQPKSENSDLPIPRIFPSVSDDYMSSVANSVSESTKVVSNECENKQVEDNTQIEDNSDDETYEQHEESDSETNNHEILKDLEPESKDLLYLLTKDRHSLQPKEKKPFSFYLTCLSSLISFIILFFILAVFYLILFVYIYNDDITISSCSKDWSACYKTFLLTCEALFKHVGENKEL
ncbi:hypothetical protein WA158_001357 [Blastocystis sp. Blastoise]